MDVATQVWRDKDLELLLDVFYEEYARAPNQNEFNLLTGMRNKVAARYTSYRDFLDWYGYDLPYGRKTYQLLDSRGRVILTGTLDDIAEKFNKTVNNVARARRLNWRINWEYKLVLKPFDAEMVLRKYRKEVEENEN